MSCSMSICGVLPFILVQGRRGSAYGRPMMWTCA